MVRDPLSLLDALVVALSGFVIVFLMLALLWGIILVISRVVSGVEHHPVPAMAAPVSASAPARGAAPAAAPPVVSEGIDEMQAACVMAIVSHETGIPLDQLVFKSIKAV